MLARQRPAAVLFTVFALTFAAGARPAPPEAAAEPAPRFVVFEDFTRFT